MNFPNINTYLRKRRGRNFVRGATLKMHIFVKKLSSIYSFCAQKIPRSKKFWYISIPTVATISILGILIVNYINYHPFRNSDMYPLGEKEMTAGTIVIPGKVNSTIFVLNIGSQKSGNSNDIATAKRSVGFLI